MVVIQFGRSNKNKVAVKLFGYLFKLSVNIFSQQTGWNKVEDISMLLNSYQEGMIFISFKNNMSW